MDLLDSAIAVPKSGTVEGYFHQDLFEMAAAYLFHIAQNQPFNDGNKRTGVAVALWFLRMNGVRIASLSMTSQELFETAIGIAEKRLKKSDVADFLRRHASP